MKKAFGALMMAAVLAGLSFAWTTGAEAALASWYGPGFAGKRTASGERFNPGALTAASRTLPFGTLVRVSRGGRSVVVRINDRGPFVGGRSIDLSRAAAAQLGMLGSGVANVSIQVIGRSGGGTMVAHRKRTGKTQIARKAGSKRHVVARKLHKGKASAFVAGKSRKGGKHVARLKKRNRKAA